MLKQLQISNIILIESTEIHFEKGLNVLSGETGSGKSAIMDALCLVAGERTDISLIRKGAERGIVEAVFDIEGIPCVSEALDEGGIDYIKGEELIIRREINASGKSRAFINSQLAQIGLLRKVAGILLDMIGQHANQRLLSTEHHRKIVDVFGGLENKRNAFSQSWDEENAVRHQLSELINSEAQRLRDIEVCRMEIEEIQNAALKEGEDEDLFAEYSLLTNAGDLARNVNEVTQALTGEKNAVLTTLSKQRNNLENLRRIDPSLDETAKSFENALLELQEIAYSLRNYQSRIEHNPERADNINERLTLINRLKRKYGSSVNEIQTYLKQSSEKLNALENADAQIDDLKARLKVLEQHNNVLSQELSESRKQTAKNLEKMLVKQLRALNMPKVEFLVEITQQKRTRSGDDHVEFYLIPNIGEHKIPIKDCASGGELSRLMLALQTILAGKEQIPTLIFDEIDANIGGETAVVVGEKLKEISQKHQVLCITHFPQVASQAHHHLQISKSERKGRTISFVKSLDPEARREEIARMLGGHAYAERT